MAGHLRPRQRRGVALLELALVLQLVVLILFGILEYGWMFLRLQEVTQAARHGARIGAVADATSANVMAAVEAMMAARGMAGLADIEILPAGEVADLDSGTTLTVRVSVPYADVGLGVPLLSAFAPTELRASVSMAKEGP